MGPASPQTLTQPSRSSTPSGSSPPTSLTFCPRSLGGSCPRTRPSTVSRECSRTLAWTPSRERSTTCPSPLPCTGSPTCNPPLPGKQDNKSLSSIVWLLEQGWCWCNQLPSQVSDQHLQNTNFISDIISKRLILLCSVNV